jgi:endothelin-converting enzyme/putative endopeptidase
VRRFGVVALLALAPAALAAEASARRGIETGDLERGVAPCTDFYEFANGAWRAQNPIPPSMVRWSRRWAAAERVEEQLKTILDEASARTDWPKASVEQLIGDAYGACMDEPRVESQGVEPIRPLLAEIDGLADIAGVQRMVERLHGLAIPVPFGLAASPDRHDPRRVIADVYASGLGLPGRDYYLNADPRFQEARERYRIHVAHLVELSGKSRAESRREADAVFGMERQLAAASLDDVSRREPRTTDHRTGFVALTNLAPDFDWPGYFAAAKLPRSAFNVQEPEFLKAVDGLLLDAPLASWKAYLRVHLLRSAAPHLSSPFAKEAFAFDEQYLLGAKEMKPRWKLCVESTDRLLGEALGRKYVEKHFPPEAKARVEELVGNLLLAMGDTIRGLGWMGLQAKAKALEKLAKLHAKIGCPDRWRDYSGLPIRRDAHWANVASAREFGVDEDRARIGKAVDRGRWEMTPPTSDASYDPLRNEIVLPAGILQPPAFSLEAADAVNYGAIGVMIAHEISHGFDDQGAQYDAQGQLVDWWARADVAKFRERRQCMVEQFDGYEIEPGLRLDGRRVLGEAIGELAGVTIAYRAFLKSIEGKPPAPTIDGFTPVQQFFIAWGQFRGDAIRPETQRFMVPGDPHPTGKYGVIGALSNLPEFRKAFDCPADAPMVRPPEKRCEVW